MYKTILVPAPGPALDSAVFETALWAARMFTAHAQFLHVRLDVREVMAAMASGEMGSGAWLANACDKLEADIKQREHAVRLAVEAACAQAGLPLARLASAPGATAGLSVETGREADWIAEYGRTSDLIVMGRGREGGEPAMDVLQAALMDSGRPLLIAAERAPDSSPGTVVIGWKDTAEAAHATALGLPFLLRASRIVVMTVAESGDGETHSAKRLVSALRRHNAAVEFRPVKPAGRAQAGDLLDAAMDVNAGLLILGGYGHSRLREFIFGGFTQQILRAAPIPVLMAH